MRLTVYLVAACGVWGVICVHYALAVLMLSGLGWPWVYEHDVIYLTVQTWLLFSLLVETCLLYALVKSID
jgi:hypothetical protein